MNVMTNRIVADSTVRASATARDGYICWSRMQAEAGQGLEAIIRRKELERQSNEGVFVWGVGNAPARLTRLLAQAQQPVRAIFSIMKSKPRVCDAEADELLVWRAYVDTDGIERPLPAGSIVTSRASAGMNRKRAHYALVCKSERVLALDHRGARFDPGAFRNVGGQGRPVGASQVTALLRQVAGQREDASYAVNMEACLVGSYWVRLTAPVPLPRDGKSALDQAEDMTVESWLELACRLRGSEIKSAQGQLL